MRHPADKPGQDMSYTDPNSREGLGASRKKVAQSSSLKEVVNHRVSSGDKTSYTHDNVMGLLHLPLPPSKPCWCINTDPGAAATLSVRNVRALWNLQITYLVLDLFILFYVYVYFMLVWMSALLCASRNWSHGQL